MSITKANGSLDKITALSGKAFSSSIELTKPTAKGSMSAVRETSKTVFKAKLNGHQKDQQRPPAPIKIKNYAGGLVKKAIERIETNISKIKESKNNAARPANANPVVKRTAEDLDTLSVGGSRTSAESKKIDPGKAHDEKSLDISEIFNLATESNPNFNSEKSFDLPIHGVYQNKRGASQNSILHSHSKPSFTMNSEARFKTSSENSHFHSAWKPKLMMSEGDQPISAATRPLFDHPREVANAEKVLLVGSAPRNYHQNQRNFKICTYTQAHAEHMKSLGVTQIISFNELDPDGIENLAAAGIKFTHRQTIDGKSPGVENLVNTARDIANNAKDGKTYLHCGAGLGRTGTGTTAFQILTGEIKDHETLKTFMRNNFVEEAKQEQDLKDILDAVLANKLEKISV